MHVYGWVRVFICKNISSFTIQVFIHVCVNVLFSYLRILFSSSMTRMHTTDISVFLLFLAFDTSALRGPSMCQASFKRLSSTKKIQWSCTLHALNNQLMLVAGTPIMQSPSMISRQTPSTHAVCMFTHPLCEPSTSHACSISMLLNPT